LQVEDLAEVQVLAQELVPFGVDRGPGNRYERRFHTRGPPQRLHVAALRGGLYVSHVERLARRLQHLEGTHAGLGNIRREHPLHGDIAPSGRMMGRPSSIRSQKNASR